MARLGGQNELNFTHIRVQSDPNASPIPVPVPAVPGYLMLRALRSLAAWPHGRIATRLRRFATTLEAAPLGRRFDPRRDKLGWSQRWYLAQPTQRVVISVLELRTPVHRELVELALRGVCARHPDALGVCEVRDKTQLVVRALRASDALPWFEPQAEVWQLAAAMTHVTFSPGAPLFRIAIDAQGCHVVAAFDHAIADGVSAGIFAAELGAFLAGEVLMPPARDAPLPLDARLDLRPSLGILARALRAQKPTRLLLGPPASVPQPSAAVLARTTGVVARAIPREVVDGLRREARWHSLTLHAVLSAAALLSALEALDSKRSWVRLNTPISLRGQCRPKPDGLGVFVSGADTDLDVAVIDDPWALASRCSADLARQRPDAHRSLGLMAFAGDLEARARKYEEAANGRTATVEVSNVGRVTGVPSGAAVWLTQGAHYHAPLLVLTVATSDSDGALRCCLSYPEPLVAAAHAERFMQTFERRLLEMRDTSNAAATAVDA